SQPKNSDYLKTPDEAFSQDHLHFSEEGFVGFSDYLTIGDDYSEAGFAPYAVAIHLSYTDEDKNIRVRHFVSDSNEDWSDVGGKFSEALEKLIPWARSQKTSTKAIQQFEEYYESGHFPGLGSIKKLSIMNHIELVLPLI
ncbi:MAG: sce7725 family protein, partial [Bacteroidota bacterium]|nr:sce7725 family protein [Bacteroidota bacterium]